MVHPCLFLAETLLQSFTVLPTKPITDQVRTARLQILVTKKILIIIKISGKNENDMKISLLRLEAVVCSSMIQIMTKASHKKDKFLEIIEPVHHLTTL